MTPEGGGAGGSANYAWPAIYPDGTLFLGDSSIADGSSSKPNRLFEVVLGEEPSPVEASMNGWPDGQRAALPAFSPDGKWLAFTDFGETQETRRSLAFMPFDKETLTFGTKTELYTPPNTEHSAIFPAFLPTNDALVFHLETKYNGHEFGETRNGAKAELWWIDLATKTPARLDKLNGVGYLPVGDDGHADDTQLNYEPTVNPVPSGGYVWVVFTSRRLYGNVATINPYHSDPRYHDLTQHPTPKKLWVAAIDLNAEPGTDPSHPAFYLPGQELLAGNSRGYWVVDPCKSDGNECDTGDECCGGFCRPSGQDGKLVCSNVVPSCAQEYERCSTAADCCGAPTIQCINERCAYPGPK